jgi:hypothetical protein
MRKSRLLVFAITFSLFALNAKAQPGEQSASYHIRFTLPPEMEGKFVYGLPLDTNDLNLDCKFYFDSDYGTPPMLYKQIYLEEPTHSEPSQIFAMYKFNLGINLVCKLDSIRVNFKTNNKNYTTTLLPNENCICDFTGEYQRQKKGGRCKTYTRYPIGRPDTNTLITLIEQLKNAKKSKLSRNPSSDQILRVVNSNNEPLFPLVIANGDTCEIVEGSGFNAIVLPFPWVNQKISLKIFHPDYPSLILDSVSRYGGLYDYVYLLREDEDYFLDGGKHMPLEKGYKEIAFWFDQTITDQTLDSVVYNLTSRGYFEITKDWRKIIQQEIDSLGLEFVDSKYGGMEDHLKRVVYFKYNKVYEFSLYGTVVDEYKITELRAIQIPVSFHEYLVPRLRIHFKKGLSETEILNFENEYLPAFERIDFDTNRPEINLITRTYQFNDWIFVPNYLQEVIMKDPRVSYCGDTVFEYILTE